MMPYATLGAARTALAELLRTLDLAGPERSQLAFYVGHDGVDRGRLGQAVCTAELRATRALEILRTELEVGGELAERAPWLCEAVTSMRLPFNRLGEALFFAAGSHAPGSDVEWTELLAESYASRFLLEEAPKRIRQWIGILDLAGDAVAGVQLLVTSADTLGVVPQGPASPADEVHQGGQSGAGLQVGRATHGPLFEWLRLPNGIRYDFGTPRQREIIKALYDCRMEGGEGAGMAEQALPVEIERAAVKSRPDKIFRDHAILSDSVLRRTAPGTWALFLDPAEGPQKDR